MDMAILHDAFSQARLKVDRAKRHINEAQRWYERYIQEDFCRVTLDTDPQTGQQTIHAVADPIPAHMVLAIGDSFHNMNAALDYLMTGMMRAASVSSVRVHFPTDETRQALRKSMMAPKPGKGGPRNRRIVKTFPAFVMLLLTRIKPYKGGNFALWEIAKADNIDKHNLIIPTVTVTELRGVDIESVNQKVLFQDCTFQPRPGLGLNLNWGALGPFEIRDKGKPSAEVTFPESSEVFAGDPVFPTLLKCLQFVGEVIDIIERAGVKPYAPA